ncbi:MAG: type II toxin-antitoxin system RelE/ParE family toxin [Xanthobacteraceae bacterium]
MIRDFRDRTTEAVFRGESPKGFPPDLVKVARRKLGYLDAALDLQDLRVPPGNRLEALVGDRRGQHSIRVNDQFRICFRWTREGPTGVEITDYH